MSEASLTALASALALKNEQAAAVAKWEASVKWHTDRAGRDAKRVEAHKAKFIEAEAAYKTALAEANKPEAPAPAHAKK